ncbi:MAG: C4-type zinc ribbon domain-containing protein [Candidatus Omnitrophica bacterium]|nr:C4-type zinc ribbon domain-containing protein [Candidatus Omnitrophota bacterium]
MKDIEALKELQKIDVEIFKIRTDLEEKPQKIKKIEDDFNALYRSLKELEDVLKKMQLEHKEKELELQSKEDVVKKQKGQLYQVKTNKELYSLQLEINKENADNSLLEDEIIVIMEKVDKFKRLITQEKAKLAQEQVKLNKNKADIEVDIRELSEKLEALNASRKRAVEACIDPQVLQLYERILENKGEIAIVPIDGEICSGCFRSVRPQVVNELRLGKLKTCENCARIIYVENDN